MKYEPMIFPTVAEFIALKWILVSSLIVSTVFLLIDIFKTMKEWWNEKDDSNDDFCADDDTDNDCGTDNSIDSRVNCCHGGDSH